MDKFDYIKPIIILTVLLTVLYLIVPRGFNSVASFDFNLKGEDYSGMFVHLFIVAVIVERFIEVYTAIWRKRCRVEIEGRLREAKAKSFPLDSIVEIEIELENYRADTGIRTMYGAFAIGLVIALAGVNTLGVLFNATEMSPVQTDLFKAIDILITSGIIAGGSKGINKMSSLISVFITTSEKNVKDKA